MSDNILIESENTLNQVTNENRINRPLGVNHNNHRTQNSQQSESFTWWIYTKPELQDEHKPQECLQEAGEILYIPSGWWWSNVNVDDTITMQVTFSEPMSEVLFFGFVLFFVFFLPEGELFSRNNTKYSLT